MQNTGNMQNTSNVKLETPSLPKGGGAISGLNANLVASGPDGAATLSIPLPVNAGRGYSPDLALTYHSRSGNGIFGMGWSLSQPAVRRRTNKGVPKYDASDEFIGPDGEVLVAVLNSDSEPQSRSATVLVGVVLGENFTVYAYRSRVESDFSRFEYWVADKSGADFWLQYSPDGQLNLLGRQPQGRISHPDTPAQTAIWLLESSVSATGEQIYWQYRAENDEGCDEAEKSTHPVASIQRYLCAVWYGNRKAGRELPALLMQPIPSDWLFLVVFDYGERGIPSDAAPQWLVPGSGKWLCRQDRFSNYDYGFEIRTRRLCQRVMMYHAVSVLDGTGGVDDEPQLISSLLLNYNENPTVTILTSIQKIAYEPDSTLLRLPPLTMTWQDFTPPNSPEWQPRPDMSNYTVQQPYQLVDLDGEGIAGILYQDGNTWWYRAPVRAPGADEDSVTWDSPSRLPVTPSLSSDGMLVDINGDGWLEWVPDMTGYYERTAESRWSRFTAFLTQPIEYSHFRTLIADITGSGMTDMILIGPRSIRLYSGTGDGWKKAQTIMLADSITLPILGNDARVMVAFSDMVGSGQQQLVEVCADHVRYWPILGNGNFAHPVTLDGFSQPAATFDPGQLVLADTDGSGTTDLIYIQSDQLLVYRNQSGNTFAAPLSVKLPEGVCFDNTCTLQVADIQGLGLASLVLMVPHPIPRSWVCHLTTHKPWLLNGLNNNMGAIYKLHYRSSAQFRLDDKAEAMTQEKAVAPSYLPFALHTLCRTETLDEITGNYLTSSVRYRHGVWDGREREFCGFGFVESSDTDIIDPPLAGAVTAGTSLRRSWYATGIPAADLALPEEYWRGDVAAFSSYTPRFTTGSGEEELVYTPDNRTAYWLYRGMRGMLLRSELYGVDGNNEEETPYTVMEARPQVRLAESRGDYPIIWPVAVESRTYVYERIKSDPQCRQQILLSSDDYGLPLKQVNICYPRRPQSTVSPWPYELPEGLFAASFDEQQQYLHLTLEQTSWHQLTNPEQSIWLTGLPDASRSDGLRQPATEVPATGLQLENLLESDGLLCGPASPFFIGQNQVHYLDTDEKETTDTPAFPPRVAFTESAQLDDTMPYALAQDITPALLAEAGYSPTSPLFSHQDETAVKLWSVRQGYATWADAEHFWLPIAYQDTALTGGVAVIRDPHDCVILKLQDSAGLTSSAEYDWRFLLPVRVTDPNANIHVATLDGLGRVVSQRFWGTERGESAGYSDTAFTISGSVDEVLSMTAPLPVAFCSVYMADSWMRPAPEQLPPHVATLLTDRYDDDVKQQIRQQVTFSDGFGRVLQSAVRQSEGSAWQRNPNGSLATRGEDGPLVVKTAFRWAVTGRTEYNNKGQPRRKYQPFFLDTWKYVSNDSARLDLYADTHIYDPSGRECQVITSKNWQRRTLFTPWCVISEDENDTKGDED